MWLQMRLQFVVLFQLTKLFNLYDIYWLKSKYSQQTHTHTLAALFSSSISSRKVRNFPIRWLNFVPFLVIISCNTEQMKQKGKTKKPNGFRLTLYKWSKKSISNDSTLLWMYQYHRFVMLSFFLHNHSLSYSLTHSFSC